MTHQRAQKGSLLQSSCLGSALLCLHRAAQMQPSCLLLVPVGCRLQGLSNKLPELLIAKFRLKMKKVAKTTRPFRYDRNQIPYNYTGEVRNRFKGLDLIDREPDELWTEVRDIVQETGIKTIPMEKKCKKAKWLSEEALQIAVKRREAKSKGEKET